MMQAHPGRDAGIAGGAQDVAVMPDGRRIVDTLLGLEPRPLDRQPMVGQPEAEEEGEVLGITRAEAVAGT